MKYFRAKESDGQANGKMGAVPTSSLIAVFVFSFVVGFGAVVSPGPVSAAIISQSPRHGWVVGPLVALGHSILEFIMVVLIAAGLSSGLAQASIQMVIAILGGLFLLWMGGSMLLGAWQGKVHIPGISVNTKIMTRWQFVTLGIMATISNPFWYAWWVTVAAGYLAQAQALGISSVVAFYAGHISADFAWDTTLSAVIGGGRKWITDTIYRWIIGVCGGFFIYLGVWFLFQGVNLATS